MQNTDKELLELAAKAAGVELEWDGPPDIWQPIYYQGKTYHVWNPLTDDGDALRLAVKLLLEIDMGCGSIAIRHSTGLKILEAFKQDPYASTRRAIVRVAAKIGRNMK